MKRTGYIYKYTFPNGKVYIGQTRTSVQQRHYVHMSDARRKTRGNICDIALAKYGEIKPETIETIEVEETECTKLIQLLNEAERKWIKYYDSTNNAKGYNIQEGGERVTPDEMILQEKWYELFAKDGWDQMLGYFHANLESIGKKLCVNHEKLNKDERFVWYGYKFISRYDESEITFSGYYKRYLDICSEDEYDCFSHTILQHAWDDLIEDVRQTIWRKVMKKKDKYIKEYWATASIKQI